jgi:hypothetical protein
MTHSLLVVLASDSPTYYLPTYLPTHSLPSPYYLPKVYVEEELPAERVYEFVRATLATLRRSGLGLGSDVAGSK